MAAVTNYHKCSGLEEHKFILLQLWRPQVHQFTGLKFGPKWFLLEVLGQKPVSLPFLASGGCMHALAQDSFFQSFWSFASGITSPTYSFDLLGSLVEEPLWLQLGPMEIMQVPISITSASPLTQSHLHPLNSSTSASPFYHTRWYSRFQELVCGYVWGWGVGYPAYHVSPGLPWFIFFEN